jgi:hypothetical protein
MVSGDEVGFPSDVALGDRLPQCERLELDAHPREVPEVVERERPDAVAPLWRGFDELLTRQAGHRFAHDAEAHAVLLRDLVERKSGGGQPLPEQDLGSKRAVDVLRE